MEQRQHPRYAIELDAEIVSGGESILGRTHDISKGGFCLLLPRPLEAGSPCEVKLALVFSETEFSEQLSLKAQVAWCTKVKDAHQVGVKFEALDSQALVYLN